MLIPLSLLPVQGFPARAFSRIFLCSVKSAPLVAFDVVILSLFLMEVSYIRYHFYVQSKSVTCFWRTEAIPSPTLVSLAHKLMQLLFCFSIFPMYPILGLFSCFSFLCFLVFFIFKIFFIFVSVFLFFFCEVFFVFFFSFSFSFLPSFLVLFGSVSYTHLTLPTIA